VRPLTGVPGITSKLWSLMLAELLHVGDPGRERCATVAGMNAIDSLVHNSCIGPAPCTSVAPTVATDRGGSACLNSILF